MTERQRNEKLNHIFLLNKAAELSQGEHTQILDFGCGAGYLMQAALERGMEIRGVEYFGAGSGTGIREYLERSNFLGGRIVEYDGKRLPFDDDTFDIVLSNQVFEHVPDLRLALSEVERVLRPKGMLICSFPTMDSYREGHANVLFAHWLPESRVRYYWLLLFRLFGVGRLKGNRSKSDWAQFFNEWLTKNTFYLRESEIRKIFSDVFWQFEHIESEYMVFRLKNSGMDKFAQIGSRKPYSQISAWVCKRFGSLVLVATKA